jgi:hypothetical protein
LTNSSQPVGIISEGEYIKNKNYLADKGYGEVVNDVETLQRFCEDLRNEEFSLSVVS